MPASLVTDRREDGSSSTTQTRSHGTSTFVTLPRVEHASSTESLPKASTSASLSAPLRASGRVYGNEDFFLALSPPKNIQQASHRRSSELRYELRFSYR